MKKSLKLMKLVCMVLVVSMMLIGCGQKNSADTDVKDFLYVDERVVQEQTEPNDNEKGSSGKETGTNESVPEFDWSELKFTLEGKELQIPFAVSQLTEQGWFVTKNGYQFNEFEIKPGTRTSGVPMSNRKASKDDIGFKVGLSNYTAEVIHGEKGEVGYMDCFGLLNWSDMSKEFPDLVLQGGITFGSSLEDIVRVFGEPKMVLGTLEEQTDISMRYETDDYTKVMLLYINKTRGLDGIQIEYNEGITPDYQWYPVSK